MRIVVTGSSGFIGRRVVFALRRRGHVVVGLDRQPNPEDSDVHEFVQCDLLEPARYATVLDGADHICHLAAAKGDWGISEAEYYRDNLEATRVLLGVAREAGVKRWMFYSTVAVLGPSGTPLTEQAPYRPVTPYGASKAACEMLYSQYTADEPDAQVVIVRPSVVFGFGNPPNTNVFRLIDAVYRNRFLMVGDGTTVKTTSYIDNLIAAHLFLTDRYFRSRDATGLSVYHYVDEPAATTADIVRHIHACLGLSPPRFRLPLAMAAPLALVGDSLAGLTRIDLPLTSARVRKFCTGTNFSGEKIRSTGYVQPVPIRQAVERTVEWYLQRAPRRLRHKASVSR